MQYLTGNYGTVVYNKKAYTDLSSEDKKKQEPVKPDHAFRSIYHSPMPISQTKAVLNRDLLNIYRAGNHTCFHFKNRKNICFDRMPYADIGSVVNKKVNSKIIYSTTRIVRDALAQAVNTSDSCDRDDPKCQHNFTIEEGKRSIFLRAQQAIDANRSQVRNSFESAAMGVKTGFGNCGEMTSYGKIILKGFGFTGPVKQLYYGDHTFLCIGDKGREYIIDPYENKHYLLSKIDSHLVYATEPVIFANSLTGYGEKNISYKLAGIYYPKASMYEKTSDEDSLAVKFDNRLSCVIM